MVKIALLGAVGALIPEVLRVIARLKKGEAPTVLQVVASLLMGAVGAVGVLLLDVPSDNSLQVAVMGAAFPSLFTGLVAAASKPGNDEKRSAVATSRSRSVRDYLLWH